MPPPHAPCDHDALTCAQILVFTGGCGRAFKFGPLLGKCLADMALGKKPVYDVTPLAITREAVGLKMAKRKRKVPAPKAAEANGSSNGSANGSNGNSATEQEKTGRSKGTASPTLA